jgi:hypothetical protein
MGWRIGYCHRVADGGDVGQLGLAQTTHRLLTDATFAAAQDSRSVTRSSG